MPLHSTVRHATPRWKLLPVIFFISQFFLYQPFYRYFFVSFLSSTFSSSPFPILLCFVSLFSLLTFSSSTSPLEVTSVQVSCFFSLLSLYSPFPFHTKDRCCLILYLSFPFVFDVTAVLHLSILPLIFPYSFPLRYLPSKDH